MPPWYKLLTLSFLGIIFVSKAVSAQQVLGIKEAIEEGVRNYQIIKAKSAYVKAYQSRLRESRSQYLPDLTLSAQQDYGTINGQFGVAYGFRGLSVASSGPILPKQTWNSAFGALYLANVSWDFFSFGRAKRRNNVAEKQLGASRADLAQEIFEQRVRIASAYLNLLAAQQLAAVGQSNLNRAQSNASVIRSRAASGLNAGVDSSVANAQVSAARILFTNAVEVVAEQTNALSVLLGRVQRVYSLDTGFVKKAPIIPDSLRNPVFDNHPLLQFYRSQVSLSTQQERYVNSQKWPTFSLFSIFQERASGFRSTYGYGDLTAFSHGYGVGVDPQIGNYLIGVGLTWNITNVLRLGHESHAQHFFTEGAIQEYDLVSTQLENQYLLAQKRLVTAQSNLAEAPAEIKAAREAYVQKSVLYGNGLATIIDLTTSIFVLNQAETDLAIANNNIWQALLYHAAATGNFDEFYSQL